MQTIPLYRYTRPDGGVTVSMVKPDTKHTELYRLVADEGYTLTDGNTTAICTDTDNPGTWSEIIEGSEHLTETEEKAKAYDVLTGMTE